MKIGIIGTGAYGIALSSLFDLKNIELTMWTKLEDEFQELINKKTNSKVLDYRLNDKIKYTMNIKEITNQSDVLILAIPAKFVKNIVLEIKKYYVDQLGMAELCIKKFDSSKSLFDKLSFIKDSDQKGEIS